MLYFKRTIKFSQNEKIRESVGKNRKKKFPQLWINMNFEIISTTSEETLISFGVVACSFSFLIWKVIASLRAKIAFYESANETGRQSLERDLRQMNEIVLDIRREYSGTRENIEGELVELEELLNYEIQPKMKELTNKQSTFSTNFDTVLSQIMSVLNDIGEDSNQKLSTVDLSIYLNQISDKIVDIQSRVENLQQNGNENMSIISDLKNDLILIKKGHGIE